MSILAGYLDRHYPRSSSAVVDAMLASLSQTRFGPRSTYDREGFAIGVDGWTTAGLRRRAANLHEFGPIMAAIDGRLDRTSELCERLGIDEQASDPEIVAAAYQRFGLECFDYFRGDFAIVIWDGASQVIVAGRDSFAVRPLYYARKAGLWLALASDPEMILASGSVSTAPDEVMAVEYLLRHTQSVDRTFFQDIKSLPAGHVCIESPSDFRITQFRPRALARTTLQSRENYWSAYQRRFEEAVEACIESRSPVIAELSGGLDSSSIVCTADRLLAKKPNLCPSFLAAGATYQGLSCDEEPFIRAVAAHVAVPVTPWDGTRGAADELSSSSVSFPGGRFATSAGTDGQFEIAQERNARVLLSGVGGDQIGTPSGGVRDAITELRWGDAAQMILKRPDANFTTVGRTAQSLVRSFLPRGIRRAYRAVQPIRRRPRWLASQIKQSSPSQFGGPWVDLDTEIQRRTWRSLTSGPHALVMAYIQHRAVRAGVDVRFPFLDMDLVALALSVPSRYWPPPWPFERLHREILRHILPRAIAARKDKANFEQALTLRVRRHLPEIHDLLAPPAIKSREFIDLRGARALLAKFERSEVPSVQDAHDLWAISTLEAWMHGISRYAQPRKRGLGNAST